MQKWEYFRLYEERWQWTADDGREEKKDTVPLTSRLNELGAQGWELAAGLDAGIYVFKRPVPVDS